MLPPGKYQMNDGRGPEYRLLTKEITVPDSVSHRESFALELDQDDGSRLDLGRPSHPCRRLRPWSTWTCVGCAAAPTSRPRRPTRSRSASSKIRLWLVGRR